MLFSKDLGRYEVGTESYSVQADGQDSSVALVATASAVIRDG